MKKYHISRDGKIIGEFTESELLHGFNEGRFVATDLVWQEGMESWSLLSEIMRRRQTLDLSNTLIGTSSASKTSDVFSESLDKVETLAWESRYQNSIFSRLVESIKQILFRPHATFEHMLPRGGFRKPLFLFILLYYPFQVVETFYQIGISAINRRPSPLQIIHDSYLTSGLALTVGIAIWIVFPILWLFFYSGIYHLLLKVVKGATQPYQATFRVICYSVSAPNVFLVIPALGRLVLIAWILTITCIGLAKIHKVRYRKPIITFILLVICGTGLLGGLVMLAQLAGH